MPADTERLFSAALHYDWKWAVPSVYNIREHESPVSHYGDESPSLMEDPLPAASRAEPAHPPCLLSLPAYGDSCRPPRVL